ncbi:30S ribosomal protein S8 [Candidatus Saganbacteria bacterium]|uniref:Small ribosomal subunit protein uS8 n=1 Tax=Candidatus Saganbacteria bacterium TaxID=2575572 RepID=A0A9D6UK77_UNCSA|nr:30S ribosomal protein S8 [Candidatus Saganbacteria bacterium]
MDPIADLLVRIKSALNARQDTVDIPYSKNKEKIVRIFSGEGYIGPCEVLSRMGRNYLRLGLKYTKDKKAVIAGMKRVSKPGRRIYVGASSLPRVQSGFGTAVISTSKGLMTYEEAREKKIGGEVICYIW